MTNNDKLKLITEGVAVFMENNLHLAEGIGVSVKVLKIVSGFKIHMVLGGPKVHTETFDLYISHQVAWSEDPNIIKRIGYEAMHTILTSIPEKPEIRMRNRAN